MKVSLFRVLALGVVGAVTPVVAATSIRVSNFTSFDNPDPSLPIVLRDGALLPWGIGTVSVGYFNISDSAIRDAFNSGQFLDPGVFTQIGPEVGFFFGAPVVDGMVDRVIDTRLTITSGSAIAGKSAYVIFGDQQSLAGSGQFAIFKSSAVFEEEVSGEGYLSVSVQGPLTSDNLIIGNDGGSQIIGPYNPSQSIQLVAIPEPSAALTAGLVGWVFLIRRKRGRRADV